MPKGGTLLSTDKLRIFFWTLSKRHAKFNGMKLALYLVFVMIISAIVGFLDGRRYERENNPPPKCAAICTPYTDAADRCDRALLTCLSWQVVVKQEVAELQLAFVNFKNAITGCVQQ